MFDSTCNCRCSPEARILGAIKDLEDQMALSKQELLDRMNAAEDNLRGDVGRLADEVRDLKEEMAEKLAEALADKEAAVSAAIQETLSGFDGIASELEELAAATPEPVVDEPVDEEPEPTPEPEPEPTPEPEPFPLPGGEDNPEDSPGEEVVFGPDGR